MTARRPRAVVLLRKVEVDSPVHRLWAGTKLLAVAAISLTLSFNPTWWGIGLTGLLLVAGALVGRIPAAAVPRPPAWFWLALLVGGVLTSVAGLSALVDYVAFVLISFELLGAAVLIGWTTDLGDIGPAVGSILSPLRRLRVPVEEWAAAVALCVRALPLVVEELRVLIAVRRLRPRPPLRSAQAWLDATVELIVTALRAAIRRSAELGEAITARGGSSGAVGRAGRPGRYDALAGAVVAVACAAAWALP